MARPTDDDTLEPILPKHPPTAAEPSPPAFGAGSAEGAGVASSAPRGTPAWDRLVLVACAVVATLALVVCALRLSSIAEDQRLQACQVRVYAEEQLAGSDRSSLRDRLADCVGVDTDGGGSGSGSGGGGASDD